jgi:uncharacterized protein
LAFHQNNPGRSAQILAQVPLDSLKPAQQVFASTLAAELAMSRNQPKAALVALSHPSLRTSRSAAGTTDPHHTVHARAWKPTARPWPPPANAQP